MEGSEGVSWRNGEMVTLWQQRTRVAIIPNQEYTTVAENTTVTFHQRVS